KKSTADMVCDLLLYSRNSRHDHQPVQLISAMTNEQNEYQLGKTLLVNKPKTWTSFDVVNKIRYAIPGKVKVGHADTLDPLATGLLIICTGKNTKKLQEFMDREKEYTGIIHL